MAQLDRSFKVVKWYQFFDLWPDNVAAVQLGYDQNDTVSDFQVVFKYSYFVTSSSPFQVNGANIAGGTLGPGAVAAAGAGTPFGSGGAGLGGFGVGSGASVGVGGQGSGAFAGAGGGNTSIGFGINTGSTSFGFGIST